jgi:hypothetical protein
VTRPIIVPFCPAWRPTTTFAAPPDSGFAALLLQPVLAAAIVVIAASSARFLENMLFMCWLRFLPFRELRWVRVSCFGYWQTRFPPRSVQVRPVAHSAWVAAVEQAKFAARPELAAAHEPPTGAAPVVQQVPVVAAKADQSVPPFKV